MISQFEIKSCRRKVKYATAKQAKNTAIYAKHGHPYRCVFCKNWHIGH